ncbi:nitroreductase family protein [Mesorhizobium sp. M7A.F.Ca.MR.245.00.0.0]|uniref:nitroreductase family protein n=1 Tax=Mesorhizobium sp. M7A.F.Ca.MR.245.00.0.0 TaxID=2496778 RepID=UPI000FCC3F81|nr:nitroreductase family protein [Mesorhizobium sp. M7A.F.Ca.MR.245.00.0.0]RUV23747.1 NADPH-dependent oxidoreductase [Mesorhizobium sp. M7A.F.Ca.MR.245.00.0.0]RUV50682.1 NADPH-dependent oxidoreductase [Mesorhizobium sp. M7A.F.Ca.MR.228.00.0.0]
MTSKQRNSVADGTAARERVGTRYRDPALAEELSHVTWNSTLDVMLSHRSVRYYLDQPLPANTLELVVAAAQSAASTSNLQAWSVIAVEDKDRKARLAGYAADQKHIHDAPLLLVFVADLARLRAISDERGHAGVALDYIEAFIFAIADAAFAAQNAAVAIESLGLGCCYIGAMRNDPQAVANELGLPDESMVVFGMTVGRPDPAVATDVKPRLPQGIILHRERYTQIDPELMAAYEARMREFQAEQNMRNIDWTEQTAARIKDVAALTGRHVLTDFLKARRFGLK